MQLDAASRSRSRSKPERSCQPLLQEPIARQCNHEDDVTGPFWGPRFRCERLLDEAAVLACCVYVDLNWVRANMAQTPEASTYTSAKERIDAWRAADGDPEADLWLAPIQLRRDAGEAQTGLLRISLEEYLRILDLTGRVVRTDKAGAIPAELAPILKRLEIDPDRWSSEMRARSRHTGSVVGSAASRAREALRRGGRWVVSAMRLDGKPAEAVPT